MGVSPFIQRQKSNLSDLFVLGYQISRLVGLLILVETVNLRT